MNVVETAVTDAYKMRQQPSRGPRSAFAKGAAHWMPPQTNKPKPKKKR